MPRHPCRGPVPLPSEPSSRSLSIHSPSASVGCMWTDPPNAGGALDARRRGELEELVDRIGGNGGVDGELSPCCCLGIPTVHRRLLGLVADDEGNILLSCPGPNRFARVGATQGINQTGGSVAEGTEQLPEVLRLIQLLWYLGRILKPPFDDCPPEILHFVEMGHQIAHRPPWAAGHALLRGRLRRRPRRTQPSRARSNRGSRGPSPRS